MYKKGLALAMGAMLSSQVLAVDLQKQLEAVGATNVKITDSPVPNFKMATSNEGVVYISQDGRFVIYGKVFELKNGKAVDITNQMLLSELNSLSDQMIIYPAKNQKHVVTVFMDITCHYCQVLHQKIKEYNDLGITIRYLAFPRAGLNSQSAKQMEAIWTAKDKVFALDEAEKGNPPTALKTPNIVKKQYELGIKFGVNGTPNLITAEGEMIPGFVEPAELLKMLEK